MAHDIPPQVTTPWLLHSLDGFGLDVFKRQRCFQLPDSSNPILYSSTCQAGRERLSASLLRAPGADMAVLTNLFYSGSYSLPHNPASRLCCNLARSTSEEARRAARAIPDQDALDAVTFMKDALKDASTGRQQNGGRATVGAVLVDPAVGRGRGRVVATASRERQRVHDEWPASMRDHPLHHAAMLCVQGVGRALSARPQVGDEGESKPHVPPRGKRTEAEAAEGHKSAEGKGAVEVLSSKQYLCTGFDLYITREPCLM